jgi:hypothetical protein
LKTFPFAFHLRQQPVSRSVSRRLHLTLLFSLCGWKLTAPCPATWCTHVKPGFSEAYITLSVHAGVQDRNLMQQWVGDSSVFSLPLLQGRGSSFSQSPPLAGLSPGMALTDDSVGGRSGGARSLQHCVAAKLRKFSGGGVPACASGWIYWLIGFAWQPTSQPACTWH